MRICHLCLNGPYNEGWNYQENLLPKYHAKQGHEVYQIVTPYMWEGTKQVLSGDHRYTNDFGIRIIRCKVKKGLVGGTRFDRYPEVRALLEEITPQILFIHDVQFLDILVVKEYLKAHPECVAYIDNHSDFSNSAQNWFSKKILHGMLWKSMAKRIEPYIKKFYGVLPARVDFLVDLYDIPKEKCELLVMGADDELVEKAEKPEVRQEIRQRYHIEDDDFLIMTGGKIDLFKTQTVLLMQAIKTLNNPKIKLIVFGSVVPELQEQISDLADGKLIQYIGWVNANESYNLFASAELVVFPGRHSVFWEQVVGQGIPMLVKYWEGTTHVDCGGNVKFLTQDSVSEISDCITKLIDLGNYQKMKKAALETKHLFLYSEIAQRSLE